MQETSVNILKEISVDLYDPKYIVVNAKQGDDYSRTIVISCTANSAPVVISGDDYAAFVRYMKPDGYHVFNECDIESGKIKLTLTYQMLASAGRAFGEIMLVSRGQLDNSVIGGDNFTSADIEAYLNSYNATVLSTMPFAINIVPSAYGNIGVESSDEFDALAGLLSKALTDYKYILEETGNIIIPVRTVDNTRPDEDGNLNLNVSGMVSEAVAGAIPSAVNNALQAAKDSGEFKGEKGDSFLDGDDAEVLVKALKLTKTVNNMEPDENGNIEIDIPEPFDPSTMLSGGEVSTNSLSNNAVTVDKLAANSVSSIKIIDGNVTAAKLASNSVTSTKIASSAVTADKIAVGAVSSVLTATISGGGYSGSGASWSKKITVSGIANTDRIIVDVNPTTEAQLDAWNSILTISISAANTLTVKALENISTSVPIKILKITR